MMGALAEAKHHIKDLLFHAGKRNFKVLDPNNCNNNIMEGEVWGHDPVHPLPPVYKKIATEVVKLATSLQDNNKRKRRRDSGGEYSGGQRGGWRGETRGSLTYRGSQEASRDSGRGGGDRGHESVRGRGGRPYYGQRPGGGCYMGRRALGSATAATIRRQSQQ
jgi:hypothetical protein